MGERASLRHKLIGDRAFYKKVMLIMIPIMVQNGITNFVGMLDNIMVGQVGTEQMSGVAIVNQLIFVFNLCIFGALAGAGIFGTQFYGNKDHEGVRHVFRFKLYACAVICALGLAVLLAKGNSLINLYLSDSSDGSDLMATYNYGVQYLRVILWGLIPFALVQMYSSTLRECGETIIPMAAGLAAVMVNMVGNYILIFGKFGAPVMGVEGAAIATVLSRFVELGIVAAWTHLHHEKMPFAKGVYSSFEIPMPLVRRICVTGLPLLINETLWAAGMAMISQCYSVRGLSAVAAINISNTLFNVFNAVSISLGNAVAIIIGQHLGAGHLKEARDEDNKLLVFSVVCCLVTGWLMLPLAVVFPRIYNTTDAVRSMAAAFTCTAALCMPLYGFTNATYFTLRSGGKTWITFLFDSVFVCCVSLPVAFVLSRYTSIPTVQLYICIQLLEIIKCVIGFAMVKSGKWIQNMVSDSKQA